MERIYKKINKANFGSSIISGMVLVICGVMLFFVSESSALRSHVFRTEDIMWAVLSAGLAGLGIFFIARFTSGYFRKRFDKVASEAGIGEIALVEDMNAPDFFLKGKLEVGKRYMIQYNVRPYVWSFENMIWIYPSKNTTKYRVYGFIPAGSYTEYKIVTVDRNHVQKEIRVKNDNEAKELLKNIMEKAPYLLLGYDDKLSSMEKLHFDDMIRIVEERKQNRGL